MGKKEFSENLIYTDPKTGLQWVCDGNLAGKPMTWIAANKWVATLDYAGYRDWRLPTKDELEQFAQKGGKLPSKWFNSNGFNNVQAYYYWSSSSYADSPDRAWYVLMSYGYVSYDGKGFNYFVWPVRGGQ